MLITNYLAAVPEMVDWLDLLSYSFIYCFSSALH